MISGLLRMWNLCYWTVWENILVFYFLIQWEQPNQSFEDAWPQRGVWPSGDAAAKMQLQWCWLHHPLPTCSQKHWKEGWTVAQGVKRDCYVSMSSDGPSPVPSFRNGYLCNRTDSLLLLPKRSSLTKQVLIVLMGHVDQAGVLWGTLTPGRCAMGWDNLDMVVTGLPKRGSVYGSSFLSFLFLC